MSGMKVVNREFWIEQMAEMLPTMIDPPVSHDACIVVGTTHIPVDKTVLRLNSSLLTAGFVHQDTSSGVTQIEVEPEFDDKPELIGRIVKGFYSGAIHDINESDLKVMYKFGNCYNVSWLMRVVRPMLNDYIVKSIDGSYERFKDIFTLAHFIYDTDLLESCMTVLDENYLLKMLIEDKDMLSKISYNCMELITKSEMTAISENGLFTLLASWAECREQKLCGLKDLFDNVKYELLDINFIVENVMGVMSKDKDLSSYFMGSLQQRFRSGIKRKLPESEQNRPRNKKVKTEAVNHFVTRFIDLVNKQRKGEIDMECLNNVFNCVSNSKDLSATAAKLFIAKITEIRRKPSDFYKIEWKMIKPDAILYLLQMYNLNVGNIREHISKNIDQNYTSIIEITLTWCLNNSKTVSTEILTKITNEICYKPKGFYSSDVLLPTIKHLFPNTAELKCSHSGACVNNNEYALHKMNIDYIGVTISRKLSRLEPFNAKNGLWLTLSKSDGVLQLTGTSKALLLFNRNKPFSPNFPIFCKTLDDEAIRMFVVSLGSPEKIGNDDVGAIYQYD